MADCRAIRLIVIRRFLYMQENQTNQNEVNASEKKVVSNRPNPKSTAQKKREQQDYRRKYFDYYDDIKTNIKQDW